MAAAKKPLKEDLDFQIKFYEAILQENPDYVDVLMVLGEIYTKKSLYKKGLKVDKKLARLRPKHPLVHYNLACSLSLLGDLTRSFEAIERAISLGYEDFTFMCKDPDLSNLRNDERFDQLIKKVRGSRHLEDIPDASSR
jgi:tetratricopeptide (TPR) repeat protein